VKKLSLAVMLLFFISMVTYGASGWYDAGSVVRLTTSSDKVGIGTTNPDEKLVISGGGLRIAGPEGSYVRLSNWGNPGNWRMFMSNDVGLNFQFSHYASSWDDCLKIEHNGNVGIGTTNPQSKLAVNGTITAKEIEVQLEGWSDFVFEDDYKLMPLNKLEEVIKKEKSLPGIPANKEVVENGIKLGEMQAKLLKKVEELTLYVIEQDKELNQLKEENKELRQRISILEK